MYEVDVLITPPLIASYFSNFAARLDNITLPGVAWLEWMDFVWSAHLLIVPTDPAGCVEWGAKVWNGALEWRIVISLLIFRGYRRSCKRTINFVVAVRFAKTAGINNPVQFRAVREFFPRISYSHGPGVAGPSAARSGGQICRPFVLGSRN